ncbi:MAG: metalloregulator ArsR/SmtB family transcription factor [Anaerolineae bacterium]|jgi:DNA-binding transcriptional ArsR family regulator|nr:metalloregulator ArsR/SmtB family transcription factor [Anaerolineae bacterium]
MFLPADTTNLNVKARLFRGFSDPTRLRILETLRNGELTVGVIVERTGFSQSNVSNHLACLRDCGLVVAEQRGKFVEYRLSDPRVGELLTLAETLLADVARGVYECTRYVPTTEKTND